MVEECTPSSALGVDRGDESGVSGDVRADHEERRGHVVLLEDGQHLRRPLGSGPSSKVRAIVPRGRSGGGPLPRVVDDRAAVADELGDGAGAALGTCACCVVAAARIRDARHQQDQHEHAREHARQHSRRGDPPGPHGLRNHRCHRRHGGGRLRRLGRRGAGVFLVGFADAVGSNVAEAAAVGVAVTGSGWRVTGTGAGTTGRAIGATVAPGVVDGRSGVTCCTVVIRPRVRRSPRAAPRATP